MLTSTAAPPLVLTIAGFDPTAGAGVAADLKTISANQGYGVACVTALTVQDSHGVHALQPVAAAFLDRQLGCLLADVRPRAIKIGMLANRETVEAVARHVERHPEAVVVLDPIFAATNGMRLIDDAGWNHLKKRLCPLATVLTPNLAEAERISGLPMTTPAEIEAAAVALRQLGPKFVVVTGGHLERPIDLLYDGGQFTPFVGDRVRTNNTHGTGCTFSAALATNLALGKQVSDAVLQAKAYLSAALKLSYPVGAGRGPLNHLYRLQESLPSRNVDPAPHTEFTTR